VKTVGDDPVPVELPYVDSRPDRAVPATRRPPLAALLYGLLLTAMAGGQLASLDDLEDALASYGLRGASLSFAVVGLPALELLVAVGLLACRVLPRPVARAAGVLGMAVAIAWSALAAQAFARGLTVENCGCFGGFLVQELRWWVLLEDAYQLVLALLAARSVGVRLPPIGRKRVPSTAEAGPGLARPSGR
jgi:hypothetical protein